MEEEEKEEKEREMNKKNRGRGGVNFNTVIYKDGRVSGAIFRNT